jgi:hypothetical protein
LPLHAVRAIQREAIEVAYWDVLPAIETPTLILHGAQDKGSLLAPTDVERYNGLLHDPTVVSLPGSGHDLRSPDPAPFNPAVQAFLLKLVAGISPNGLIAQVIFQGIVVTIISLILYARAGAILGASGGSAFWGVGACAIRIVRNTPAWRVADHTRLDRHHSDLRRCISGE